MDLKPELLSVLQGNTKKFVGPKSLPAFLKLVQSTVGTTFPEADPRRLVSQLRKEDFFARMIRLRSQIKDNPVVPQTFSPIWQELGLDPHEIYLDAIRIRCVPARFQEIEAAGPVAFIHRDPWYANPQCQFNLWIPVYSVPKEAGFRIYPSYFNQPIPNNSNQFDYRKWLDAGGFQSANNSSSKPQLFPSPDFDPIEPSPLDVFADEGEMFLFSSHHLHGTSPNTSGFARFSLEIRFVLESHLTNRIGPEKIDNRSQGSTLSHMYRLTDSRPVPDQLIKHYERKFDFHQNKSDSLARLR
ncbi:hypothetical protein [Leptospira sp. 'Mane']|uniref:hypothetical protein n=1 Tax=Leptospira sp. 'Mane' TaxID=3387407 RepID=UPI00398B848E